MSKSQSTASRQSGGVKLQGKRIVIKGSIAGRDIKNIIYNGPQTVLINEYEPLQDAYINAWSVFERVHLKQFSGREWLLKQVDTFLQTHDCGYFILEAEAGLGKTTFMAWLACQRGYVHHFAELAPGVDGIATGLRSLAAQLILAYRLGGKTVQDVTPRAATRPDYLATLLKRAADQRQPEDKIVVVIDALDRAGALEGQNVLGLPTVLPRGVFIIVAQRPVPVVLDIEATTTPYQICRCKANSTHNLADIRQFLEQVVKWPKIARALQAEGYSEKQFIHLLLKKCAGIWVYLHYVIYEIDQSGRFSPELVTLPIGLTMYYINFWKRWQTKRNWLRIYLPLLTTLAASPGNMTIEQLIRWAKLTQHKQTISRMLKEEWRPFLALTGQPTRVGFYHATLQEFFQGRVTRKKLTEADRQFIDELAQTTHTARQQIITALHHEMLTARKAQARREAAFNLIRMDWLGDGRKISPEELVAYLELIEPYVDTSFERNYLRRYITAMLATRTTILAKQVRAQLLVYRAALLGQLGELPEAQQDYDEVRRVTREIIESGASQPEGYKFAVRVDLGAANIAVQQAQEFTQRKDRAQRTELLHHAIDLYQAAIHITHTVILDPILEVTLYQELNYAHLVLHDWGKAEEAYHQALNVLQTSRRQTHDLEAWILEYAQVLEAASDTHLSKGRYLKTRANCPGATAEFKTAHQFARKEIALLKKSFGPDATPYLVYAHMNAGVSLWELSRDPDNPDASLRTKARAHWRKALDLATQLHLDEMVEAAAEQLEHCK
jgi:tetratricopeptide (TPR) repeat protein